jgi:hypothetical protein
MDSAKPKLSRINPLPRQRMSVKPIETRNSTLPSEPNKLVSADGSFTDHEQISIKKLMKTECLKLKVVE